MSEIRKRVGLRVRELRRIRGLSQTGLGQRARLSYKFVGEVERGQANPTIETLAGIAAALDVSVADLVTEGSRPAAATAFSPADYSRVRQARDVMDLVLDRLGADRAGRRKPARGA